MGENKDKLERSATFLLTFSIQIAPYAVQTSEIICLAKQKKHELLEQRILIHFQENS